MLKVKKFLLSQEVRRVSFDLTEFQYVKNTDFQYYGNSKCSMTIFAVYDEERLVALSSVYVYRTEELVTYTLENCEVIPEYRGRGLQLQLGRLRLAEAKDGEIVVVDCYSPASYKNIMKLKEEFPKLIWRITYDIDD